MAMEKRVPHGSGNVPEVLHTYGYKKEPLESDPSVIRLGFEPKTHSLEGCCSIQLSYQTGLKTG